jgi:phage baseplate assembly protein W
MSSKLKYNFQSVGNPEEVLRQIEERRKSQEEGGTPIGIKTPMRFSENFGDLLEMHVNQYDAIRDNLRNLLLTNYGERLGHYDFGGNLISVVNELGSSDGDARAMALISLAVQKYMPFISLQGFETNSEPFEGNPIITLRLTYTVPALDPEGNKPQGIEIILNFDG